MNPKAAIATAARPDGAAAAPAREPEPIGCAGPALCAEAEAARRIQAHARPSASSGGTVRIALDDTQWARISGNLPLMLRTRAQRRAAHYRRFVENVLLVAVEDLRWCDLAPYEASWRTVYVRFVRWSESGVWDGVIEALEPHWELYGALKWRVNGYRQTRERRRHDAALDRAWTRARQPSRR